MKIIRCRVAACFALLFCALAAGCSSQQVQQNDKTHVLRATDLVDYGYGFKPISKFETFNKTAYFDNSTEIEYTFETPESEQNNPLFMSVTLGKHASNKDAASSQGFEKLGGNIGMKLNDLTFKPVKNVKTYGGTGSLQIVMYQGQPTGNQFMCRKGKRTYSVTLMGTVYFADAAAWDEFAGKKVQGWLNAP
jgi:hypothetical protein